MSEENTISPELRIDEGANDFSDIHISVDRLMHDLFNEDEKIGRLLDLFDEELSDTHDWHFLTETMMEQLGYERLARDSTINRPNSLDSDFIYEVWASEYVDWCHRSGCDDDGYIPEDKHCPEWADEVLGDLDEDGDLTETLPKVVVFVFRSHGPRGVDNRPNVGYFEGDYTVPFDLSLQWHLVPCDEDNDEAAEFAEKANNDYYLSSAEATHHLEYEYCTDIAKGDDGKPIPFNTEKRAFQIQDDKGNPYWAHPDRHYFGQ